MVRSWSNRVRPTTYVASKFTSSDDSWKYSDLYYKSKYLYKGSIHSSLSLYQDCLIKRPYHTTPRLWAEDPKDVKQKESANSESLSERNKEKNGTESAEASKQEAVVHKKESLWDKFVAFCRHYYNGFKLFFFELRICMPLFNKYIRFGRSSLKRREYMQLTKSMGDLFRIMPLIPMLIIPFAELLIPVYMKLGLMPTTFESKKDKEEQNRVKLKKKLEMAQVLSETLAQMPKKAKGKGTSSIEDFAQFMEKVKSTKVHPTTEEIVKFSRLFEDEVTLKHLSMRQLQALCNVLGLMFTAQIPSERILRFQLRMKLRELEVDDKMILKEGIDSLTVPELQAANRSRGMRALGLTEERLRLQLEQWLELHITEKIPSSLLLLSRTMYLEEGLTPAQQLKETISVLPDETVETTKVASAMEKGEQVDNKILLEIVKEEAKAIKEEEEAEKKEKEAELLKEEELLKAQAAQAEAEAEARAEAEASAEAELKPEVQVEAEAEILEKEPIPDIAEPILVKPSEELKEAAVDMVGGIIEEEVTPKDLEDIEAAIEHITLHEKEELEEVKEEMDDYKESVEQIRALSYAETQLEEYAGAKTLRNYVDKLISKTDKIIEELQKDREQLKKKIEFTEVKLKYEHDGQEKELREALSERKEHLVSINEVLLSLKRLQKVPDDMRLQRILEVLDEDQDGYIDIKNILEVTELLGRENLKLSTTEVSNMVNLLQKEAEIEFEERVKIKQDKEQAKNDNETENYTDSEKVNEKEQMKAQGKSS